MKSDRKSWPILVRIGLFGIGSRRLALFFVWLSILLAVGCIAFGFVIYPMVFPRSFVGDALVAPLGCFSALGMSIAAVHYYLAMRWVDRHGDWK